MSEIVFFFLLFICFLFCITCTIIGPYACSHNAWVQFSQNTQEIFAKEANLNNLCLLTNQDKYKSLTIFLFFQLLNIMTLGIFLWIWIEGENNFYYIIIFIISYLCSFAVLYYAVKKLFKKFEAIGCASTKNDLNNFIVYKENFNSVTTPNNFKIYQGSQLAPLNKTFQFVQRRYKNKIIKLKEKNYSQEKFNLKLNAIYILYLKRNAFLLKIIKNEWEKNDYYIIKENEKNNSIINFKKIIITNFFAFLNESN